MIQKIRHKLLNNRLLRAALIYSNKVGFLDVSMDCCEKWNYDSTLEPRENGQYDMEGHVSCDVNCYYFIKPLSNPDDFLYMVKAIYDWIRVSIELRSLDYFLEANPLKRIWISWVFVVDSFEISRSDMFQETELYRKYVNLYTSGVFSVDEFKEAVNTATAGITDKMVHDYLTEDTTYVYLGSGIYAHAKDPTIFTVNEKLHPFDLKDGWSHVEIADLIRKMLLKVGLCVNIRLKHT